MALLFLLLLFLSCGNGGTDSMKVPDELQMCSGHGTYAPADNMSSICQCDPGYQELMTGLAYEDLTPRLETSLCIRTPSRAVLGLAHPTGQPVTPQQAETMAAAGISWTIADLPAALDDLSDWSTMHADQAGKAREAGAGMTVVGRIRLDDWNLTVQSAHNIVDQAMKGAKLDYVVLQDAAVYEAHFDQLGGCSDWACFNEAFGMRRDAICHAISRVRLHCPWCQVGLAISLSPDEHLTQLNYDLGQLGQKGECPYEFVTVDFQDVDPYVGVDPEKATWPALATVAGDLSHWYLANVASYNATAFDLATPDDIASRVTRAAVLFRAAGFAAVILPNLPGSVNVPAAEAVDAAGKGTRVLDALSTYAVRVGNANLVPSASGEWWTVSPDPPQVDQVIHLGLELSQMEGIELAPKSPSKLLDAFGEPLANLKFGLPLAEQFAAAAGHFAPFYIEGSVYSTYPDAVALGLKPLFQNAWLADSSAVIPTGELAVNLDDDPDIEWWSPNGYYDPMGDGLFRQVAPGAVYVNFTFHDLDHDGDLDMLFHTEQDEGGLRFDLLLNEDGWFAQAPAWKLGLSQATLDQLDKVLDQWLAQDFTGDGLADLASYDLATSEVVVLETQAEPGVFLEHRYPCPLSQPVQWWRAEDVDGDGQLDLVVLEDLDGDGGADLDRATRFLLRRGNAFVEAFGPCYKLLFSNAQAGLQDEVGPGFVCTLDANPFQGIALYKWDGDALAQVWQDTQLPGWDTGDWGIAVPYRDEDGANTRLVLSSQYALHLARLTATGLTLEKSIPTASQAVSGYYARGPDSRTFLLAGTEFKAAVTTVEEAASLVPSPAGWEESCAEAGDTKQILDFDQDGKLDALCFVATTWDQKEHNEVGDPFAAWVEVKADIVLVSDIIAGGKGTAKKLAKELFLRYQNKVCADPDVAIHTPPWEFQFAVGEFDSAPGPDVFTYSPVQHAVLDMQPVAYLVPGKGGPVVEIPAQDYLKVGVMIQSDCGSSFMMAADMDEDGLDDVILWDGYAGEVHFLCTDKGGGLDQHILHQQQGAPFTRIVDGGDYNADGHFDLLAVRKQEIMVLLGNGKCGLGGKKDWALSTNIWFHNAATCGDLTADGQTECFFECEWSIDDGGHDEPYCGAEMPKNGGMVPWEQKIPFPKGYPGDTTSVTWGDFDADGSPEIVLGAGTEANGAYRWMPDGFHFLGSHTPAPLQALGDIDGDGTDDALGAGWTLLLGKPSKVR